MRNSAQLNEFVMKWEKPYFLWAVEKGEQAIKLEGAW